MDLPVFAIGAATLCAAAIGGLAWMLGGARARATAEALLRAAEGRASGAAARAEALVEQLRQTEGRAAAAEAALRQADSQRATEAARAEALGVSLKEQRALLDAAKTQLHETFQVVAGDALRANQEAQEKSIQGVVAPMLASLEKVDEQIRTIEKERGTAYGALRQQMQAVTETQEKLREATGSLVSALKAPAVRGQWGEMQLRRVVELAGMVEHCDFVEQETLDGEEGRLRPDMIIRAAGGRQIVVDAKVPLSAYLEAREAQDDATRAAKLRQHAAQVQSHIGKLAAKSYWEGLAAAPEIVVMFLPSEPLYGVALEQMPGLIEEGYARGVLVATPTTLLGLLRTVSFGWREERLAENAQRISDEGRRLHERIATVLDHLADLGNALNQSVKHFNRARNSFSSRVVVSARRLEDLDARGKKDLAEVEEIDVRAATSELEARRAEAASPPQPIAGGLEPSQGSRLIDRPPRLPKQPLLSLAPTPTGQDT